MGMVSTTSVMVAMEVRAALDHSWRGWRSCRHGVHGDGCLCLHDNHVDYLSV